MNDPISRQAAIDASEKFIKDCNPDHFVGHQKFIEYMDNAEIGSFGKWEFANGFNMGLTATEVAIKKLPSAIPEPQWIPCSKRLPEEGEAVLTQAKFKDDVKMAVSARVDFNYWTGWCTREIDIVAWMPLPKPYEVKK